MDSGEAYQHQIGAEERGGLRKTRERKGGGGGLNRMPHKFNFPKKQVMNLEKSNTIQLQYSLVSP